MRSITLFLLFAAVLAAPQPGQDGPEKPKVTGITKECHSMCATNLIACNRTKARDVCDASWLTCSAVCKSGDFKKPISPELKQCLLDKCFTPLMACIRTDASGACQVTYASCAQTTCKA